MRCNRTTLALLAVCLLIGFTTRPALADEKDDAKKEITAQLELIKAGKTDDLKKHFTERLQDRITPEAVEAGKTAAEKYTIEDLVDSVAVSESNGSKAIKIKMKNGRSLTTLIQQGEKWLADTVWFK